MSDLGASARAALDELADDTANLEHACASAFLDDDEAVCMNVAGEIRDFLNGTAQRLLVRVDAGDLHAAENLARATSEFRVVCEQEAARVGTELSFGAQLGRFVDEVVVQTGRDIPEQAPKLAAKGVGTFLLVALGVKVGVDLITSSAASGVRKVKRAARDEEKEDSS